MASVIGKIGGRKFLSERRAVIWFAGGFAAAMLIGQILDERHCAFDSAGEKPLVNWLGRLCSDIRVTSKTLSENGPTINSLPRRGALENMFEIPD
jgi:hypothetical protein